MDLETSAKALRLALQRIGTQPGFEKAVHILLLRSFSKEKRLTWSDHDLKEFFRGLF
jgi:hypothetical protein